MFGFGRSGGAGGGVRGKASAIGGHLAGLADDLLHIEVNTIVKDGIEARKMPAPAHALLDVLGDYAHFLMPYVQEGGDGGIARLFAPLAGGDRTIGKDSFDALRRVCEGLLSQSPCPIPAPDMAVAYRIMRTASELVAMIERLEAVPDSPWPQLLGKTRQQLRAAGSGADAATLPGGELALLRKAWEVGVERVALQTVIGLDGDIHSSVQRGCEGAEYQALRDMHMATARMSISYWSEIVALLASFVTGSRDPKGLLDK